MNMRVTTLIVLLISFRQQIFANPDHILSVTRFPEIEKFYLKVRKSLNHQLSLEQPIMHRTLSDPNSPNFSLCESILSSTHFKHQGIRALDLRDPKEKFDIKVSNEAIYTLFYPRLENKSEERRTMAPSGQRPMAGKEEGVAESVSRTKETSRWIVADDTELIDTLRYTEQSVRVFDEHVRESIVPCLARSLRPYTVIPYFVSSPYLSHQNSADQNRMYFVFRISERQLVLEALAEEAAVANYELTSVERDYLKKRWQYNAQPTKIYKDPICSLSLSTKLRICASIAASRKYREELEFVPLMENVHEICYMRDVFLYGLSLRGGSLYGSEGLSEWMYSCEARKVRSQWSSTVHLLVSRSYDSQNSVFVYKIINGRYELVDYFLNIHALYRQADRSYSYSK